MKAKRSLDKLGMTSVTLDPMSGGTLCRQLLPCASSHPELVEGSLCKPMKLVTSFD